MKDINGAAPEEIAQANVDAMDLYAFLPQQTKAHLTVETFDAPPGFVTANGERAKIKMKKLSAEVITDVTERNRQRTLVKDKRGRAMISNGRAVVDEEVNNIALTTDLLVEAFVHPNFTSAELMKAYGCTDPAKLVHLVFNTQEAFTYVMELFNDLQFGSEDEPKLSMLVEKAKN